MGQARNWTQEERDRLTEEWGTFSVATIAEHLNRSENGIIVMASRLGLGAHLKSSPWITLNELFQELGLPWGYDWNLRKLEAAGMKIHMQRVKNSSFRMVDIAEFWEFAEKNRYMFDFSRLEENALGEEPEWVKIKRAEDYKRSRMVKTRKEKWTEYEDKELLRLLRTYRYTYPEIAARLNRSEGAIQRRMTDLGIKERPLKADTQSVWTDEQLRTVCEMIKAGSSYESMSLVIGKSAKAIRGKVFIVYLTENLGKVRKLIGDGQWGDNRPDRTLRQKNCMTIEEKERTKEELGKLVGLLTYQIRKQFDDQDNWQRNLCQNWDKVKGCTVGGVDCDDCADFLRIRPQYCARCGATFYERHENRMCERCRMARKKAAARKYLRMREKMR